MPDASTFGDNRTEVVPKIPSDSTLCLPDPNSLPRVCYQNHQSGGLQSREEFRASPEVPSSVLYIRENGTPLLSADFEAQTLLHFNSEGHLIQRLGMGKYTAYRNQKPITECEGTNCHNLLSPKPNLVKPDLLPGDLVFTGNLFPWTGLQKIPVTHVSVVAEISSSGPLFLTNDIFEPAKLETWEEHSKNTQNIIVLRHSGFAARFVTVLPRFFLKSLPVPYFCGNLITDLLEEVNPELLLGWTEVDKNYAELILLNLMPHFKTIYFSVSGYEKPDHFLESRQKMMPGLRRDIESAIRWDTNYLYRIFEIEFPMLPIGVTIPVMEKLSGFVKLYVP
ncbi:MAG: hypothetical protein H3C47_16210 [Candidatus Cloacimonetes bacterium]|nr:hypothetical protein [Candidatus Cloacimonadota bacterium]